MAESQSQSERTEAPTPRRREEARQQGTVAKSPDLVAAVALLAAVVLLHVFGLRVLAGLRGAVESMLSPNVTGNPTRADDVPTLLMFGLRVFVTAAAPLVLSVTAVVLVATVSQVGLHVSTEPLMPNLGRLNPLRGLGHLFQIRAGMRLVMSLLKTAVIASVAVWAVVGVLPQITALTQLDVLPMFGSACELVYGIALKLAGLLLVLALFDYAFQWWQRERDLRMSKQEVKEELKRMEGDPLVKQRRARVARQLAMQRIGRAVPRADVVVTNPTHFAIALQYDSTTMRAPKVVAKGADFLAMRIRQLAMQHGVPLVERKELARALYRTVEVGREVPPEFYSAVAEILAYVYRLSGKKSA